MAGSTLTISPRVLETSEIVRYEFDLGYSNCSRRETLFYEFPREQAPPPPDNFDAALCATVLHAMAEGRDIHLRGPATSAGAAESATSSSSHGRDGCPTSIGRSPSRSNR